MSLRVKESDRQGYTMRAWEYMHSRYDSDLLSPDSMLKSEVEGLANLMATCEANGKGLTFDQIDVVRYIQDALGFKGAGYLYKIYLLMYDRKAWVNYKNSIKGPDRRKALKEQEQKFNDFLEKEKKRNGKNK